MLFLRSTKAKRRPSVSRSRPFSQATQRRVLADLTARALAGEVPAQEALLRLNYDYGPDAATRQHAGSFPAGLVAAK
jgi:hypothetical protein